MKPIDDKPAPIQGWLGNLAARGARVEGHRVVHFGELDAELRAAQAGTVLCDLSHLGLIAASGPDTVAFLQGQVSSDVRQLKDNRAQLSSYNTPKGRMLASLLLYQCLKTIFLQLAWELVEPIRKRLEMFVLRSKVQLADASDAFVRLGVAGAEAEALLAASLGASPSVAFDVAQIDLVTVIRLPGDRFEIVAPLEPAKGLWSKLSAGARPAGAQVWDWLEIRAGIPTITSATQDQFVPQMANLEIIGGVSFQKGCYPGQEIVARTQYLGRLKRRMYLAHAGEDTAPAPGDELYSADLDGQARGMVVNAAPAPEGGFDLLAVIQTSSATSQPIHLGSLAGPTLELRPLPYPLQPSS
ncbi:MAG: folate-binding protein [Burkholderiales bacterium]